MKIADFVQWDSPVGIARGRIEELCDDLAKVRVYRDGKPSQALVELPVEMMEKDDYAMPRMPVDSEMALINQYVPNARPDQFCSYVVRAANNFVNRSYWRFNEKSLQELADYAIGVRSQGLPLPFGEDHDWETVAKTDGFIYDAYISKEPAPEDIVMQAGNKAMNAEIAQNEGLISLDLKVAFSRYSSIVSEIEEGRRGFVSLGRFVANDLICPIDGRSFFDPDCNYLVPSPMYPPGSKVEIGGESIEVAPYSIYANMTDLGECSFVTIPKLLGVGIRR